MGKNANVLGVPMHGSLGCITSFSGAVVPRLLKAESAAQVCSALLAGCALI